MGSGKSFVGKQLAEATGKAFLDTDEIIETHEAQSVTDLFAQKGENYFRQCEHDVVDGLIKNTQESVISTGGGMPVYEDRLNRVGKVIYLKVPFENIVARLNQDDLAKRPLLSDLAMAKKRYEERDVIYNKIADVTVDADRHPKEIIKTILANLTT